MPLPKKNDIPLKVECADTTDCAIKFALPIETKQAIEGYVDSVFAPFEAAGLITQAMRDAKKALVQKIVGNIADQTAHLHLRSAAIATRSTK